MLGLGIRLVRVGPLAGGGEAPPIPPVNLDFSKKENSQYLVLIGVVAPINKVYSLRFDSPENSQYLALLV